MNLENVYSRYDSGYNPSLIVDTSSSLLEKEAKDQKTDRERLKGVWQTRIEQ